MTSVLLPTVTDPRTTGSRPPHSHHQQPLYGSHLLRRYGMTPLLSKTGTNLTFASHRGTKIGYSDEKRSHLAHVVTDTQWQYSETQLLTTWLFLARGWGGRHILDARPLGLHLTGRSEPIYSLPTYGYKSLCIVYF